jgi:hypothetical protein
MVAVVRVAQRMGFSAWSAVALALLASLAQARTARSWLDPWTTTLSAAIIWWLIEHSVAIAMPTPHGTGRPPATRQLAIFGMLLGALPLARPADLLISGICFAAVVAALAWRRRWQWRYPAVICGGASLIAVPYGILHVSIYGWRASPYMAAAADTGFILSVLPWKAHVVIVSARPWFPATKSILEMMPWLLLSAAGSVAMLSGRTSTKMVAAFVLLVAVPYSLLMLTYADLQPPGLSAFGNLHYFNWMLPFAGLSCGYWLSMLRTIRGARMAAAAAVLTALPTCLKVVPVPARGDEPARMLLFKGAAERDWNEAYFAPVQIIDAEGLMRNVGDFHQIPDRDGERAIATRRLFAADPVRFDPGETAAYAVREKAYARYAARLTIGIPCWAKPSACDQLHDTRVLRETPRTAS